MREVCFVVDVEGRIVWTDSDDHPGYLADRRDRWAAIWTNRENLSVIAHSHPGGPAAFSSVDLASIDAIMRGLGDERAVHFAVVHPDGTVLLRRGAGVDAGPLHLPRGVEPGWARALRVQSRMEEGLNTMDLERKVEVLTCLLSRARAARIEGQLGSQGEKP